MSPDRGGAVLTVARGGLHLAAAAYGMGVRARNCLYDLNIRKAHAAGVPVISVGNITAGGTGKTPFVAWLARLMAIHKMRPAILSRGYGRHEHLGVDDENAMLAQHLADIPIVVDPDRVRGAQTALREHDAELLILDDGFQHRRIARDLDIVLIDAVWPFGGGHLLPRGLLREPLGQLARSGFIVVTRSGLVSTRDRQAIKEQLAHAARGVPVAFCDCTIEGIRPLHGEVPAPHPQDLASGQWAAFCGIGNPEGFRLTLERAGCSPAPFTVFPDHERYALAQIDRILAEAQKVGCTGILTTEKDAVKVEKLLPKPSQVPIYTVQTALEFQEGSDALTAAILSAVGRQP